MAHKGKFQPQNPHKYKGNHNNIIYRSRWEARFMSFLDRDQDVIEWNSEEFFIPYRCKTDGRVHRYFPDFKIKIKTKDGSIVTKVIEIKPYGQTQRPIKPAKRTQRYLNEAYTWMKNKSKWEAAREWCANRGYKFEIITEKHLPGVFELNKK